MRTELDKQMSPVWRRAVAAEELRKSERRADVLTERLRAAQRARRRPIRAGGNLRARLARVLNVAMPSDENIAQAVVELVSKYRKLASKARGTLRMDLTPTLVRTMNRGAQ